jgi:membrane-associated phospholipid phosphatase
VEAGKHYPSDVLFGSALGNFVAVLIYDAFLPANTAPRLDLTLSREEVSLSVAFSF